jgi:glycosyltransferase involved in cell wall biosynthesis
MSSEPLRGLVTYGPRQSLTSFAASKEEFHRDGIEIELAQFCEKRHYFKNIIASLGADFRIISTLLLDRHDFVILNSGASLFYRPLLLLALLRIAGRRKIPTFVLWRNAADQFKSLRGSIGSYRYRRVANAFKAGRVYHLAVSDCTAGQVAEELGVSGVACVYNCARVPASPDRRDPEDPPIVLNVAAVSKRKRPASFVAIAGAVCKQYSAARFIWLGGKATAELESQIRDLGLERNVDFIEFDPDPYAFMQRSSLLLLTSKEEAFGLVLAEAMACARTTLCFADTGAAEVAGDTGYVVPQGDLAKASDIILSVLRRPSQERVNRAARQRYEDMFSPEAYARRFGSIIRHALKAPRS